MTLANIAGLRHGRGDHVGAVESLNEALAIREQRLPADHPLTARTRSDLGRCLTELGEYQLAENALLQSYSMLEPRGDEQREYLDSVIKRLATLYDASGRPDEAARYQAMLPDGG